MKVAFLSRYQGKVERGAETYVNELSKRLSENHEVTVLSGKDADSFSKIIKGSYDIVIPTNGRLQVLKASIGRMFGKYRVVISGQSGTGIDDVFNVLVRPDVFAALTDFAADGAGNKLRSAKTWSWGSKIVTIPNGVDLEKFKPGGVKVDLKLGKPIVLSVGALYWYKHHERTIEALAEVENASLLIIGDGSDKEKLQNLGEKILGKNRFKIVQVPFEQMPNYYRAADLFVLPSWDREAFGTVYVEALASGLPVVAPDDSPRREIVGNAGIFVDVSNPQKYANAIKEALSTGWDDKPRRQAEKFSWDKIAEQYEKLFEELRS